MQKMMHSVLLNFLTQGEGKMKKALLVAVAFVFCVSVFGCAKKESEDMIEPITMETLNTLSTTPPIAPVGPAAKAPAGKAEVVPPQMQGAPVMPAPPAVMPLAPSIVPTAQEIQSALKNAGLYAGEVDGKIGPKSTEAVKAFQQQAGLKADGKVGPMTWAALSKYLVPGTESKR